MTWRLIRENPEALLCKMLVQAEDPSDTERPHRLKAHAIDETAPLPGRRQQGLRGGVMPSFRDPLHFQQRLEILNKAP